MNSARFAFITIAVFLALATIVGCGGGGGTTHNVSSPWYGDLYGVSTEPSDGQTRVETSRTDSWIHVFWPDSHFAPPSNFTVTVEKEENPDDWGAIHTTLSNADSDPTHGSWWFQPNSDFSPNTWYRIIISVPGVQNSAVAYFQTTDVRSGTVSALSTRAPEGKAFRPAGKGDATGESADTHVIHANTSK